jgi:uncharacterized protein (TIGR02145 family)
VYFSSTFVLPDAWFEYNIMKPANPRRIIGPILTGLLSITFLILTGACDKTQPVTDKFPVCSITSPKNGQELLKGEIKIISVETADPDGYVIGVTFEIDNISVNSCQNPPYTYQWNTAGASTGVHTISVTVKDNGNNETTRAISVTLIEVTSSVPDSGTVKDYDGNTYRTVKIGNQWWMAENLNATHFYNGAEIPLIENKAGWDNLGYSDKAICYYNDSISYACVYGALYNWAAAMNGAVSSESVPSNVRGVCPAGWHVPSDEEWIALEMELGMSHDEAWLMAWRGTHEGTKMKAIEGWDSCGNGINSSGFSALPAGIRNNDGSFTDEGRSTHYWSTTEYINNPAFAFNRQLDYNQPGVGWFHASHHYGYPKDYGFSVRCVKD